MKDKISILVDYGYAFDYLAILEVKSLKIKSNKSIEAYNDCFEYLKKQINDEIIWNNIKNSKEYNELFSANVKTFDAVEKARYGETTAKYVDDCNMERFFCKKKLQEKFFPNIEVQEIKS